jgi:hypothetical protein
VTDSELARASKEEVPGLPDWRSRSRRKAAFECAKREHADEPEGTLLGTRVGFDR